MNDSCRDHLVVPGPVCGKCTKPAAAPSPFARPPSLPTAILSAGCRVDCGFRCDLEEGGQEVQPRPCRVALCNGKLTRLCAGRQRSQDNNTRTVLGFLAVVAPQSIISETARGNICKTVDGRTSQDFVPFFSFWLHDFTRDSDHGGA